MKRIQLLYLLSFSILLGSCSRQAWLYTSFREPATGGLRLLYSKDGYNWTDLGRSFLQPEAGAAKIMRDPSIAQGPDGTFHLVWTSAWTGNEGFGYASSKDLVHWSPAQLIPIMKNEPEAVNVWAPEIYYDEEETHQFIIVWASTIPYRFPKGEEDEKNNHRLYYTTTKDFKTFAPARLFLDPGFSAIDAAIVKEAPGKYVLVLKDNTRPNRNIKVAFSNHAMGPYTNVSEAFTPHFTEGPSVLHKGREWLIYYDAYRDKKFGAMKTTDFKTFTDITNNIHVPEGHKHGTIIKVSRKQIRNIERGIRNAE